MLTGEYGPLLLPPLLPPLPLLHSCFHGLPRTKFAEGKQAYESKEKPLQANQLSYDQLSYGKESLRLLRYVPFSIKWGAPWLVAGRLPYYTVQFRQNVFTTLRA